MSKVISKLYNNDIAEVLGAEVQPPVIQIAVDGKQLSELVGVEYDPKKFGGAVLLQLDTDEISGLKEKLAEAVSEIAEAGKDPADGKPIDGGKTPDSGSNVPPQDGDDKVDNNI